eukprot:2732276-Prymnesium_polylepis.1
MVHRVRRERERGGVGREEQERLETVELAVEVDRLVVVARRERVGGCDKKLRVEERKVAARAACYELLEHCAPARGHAQRV